MLRKIAHLGNNSHTGVFYDHLNQSIYTIQNGYLHTRNLHPQQSPNTKISIPFIHYRQSQQGNNNSHLKHPHLQLIKGQALFDSYATLAKNVIQGETIIRSSHHSMLNTKMIWQIYVPNSLYNIQFGICCKKSQNEYQYIFLEFKSSTSRTVTFTLQNSKLNVWINGIVPNRNHFKIIDQKNWYPCIKIKQVGTSFIFNPFATHPQSKISIYNPFGTQEITNAPNFQLTQKEQQKQTLNEVKLTKILSLGSNKMLLISQNKYKVLYRNIKTNKFQFSPVSYNEKEQISNLFSKQQYEALSVFEKSNNQVKKLFPFRITYSLDYILNWIQFLVKFVDKLNQNNIQLFQILLRKLLIIRKICPEKVSMKLCNLIFCSQDDRQPFKYSANFLSFQTRAIEIESEFIYNHEPWKQIQGNIVSYSENYICYYLQATNCLRIYNNEKGLNLVYKHELSKDCLSNKSLIIQNNSTEYASKYLQNFENKAQGPSIYKILNSCFQETEQSFQKVYQINEKRLFQLTNDYKIDEASAKRALRAKGNIDDALVWLAQGCQISNEKQIISSQNKQIKNSNNVKINILEFTRKFKTPLVKIILQINEDIYLLGINPRQGSRHIKKIDKNYMSLQSFQIFEKLEDIQIKISEYSSLWMIQSLKVKNAWCLQKQSINDKNGSFNIITEEGDIMMRLKARIQLSKLYQPQNSLTIDQNNIPFDQFVDKNTIKNTQYGQIYWQQEMELIKKQYQENTTFVSKNYLYSNCIQQTKTVSTFKLITSSQTYTKLQIFNNSKSNWLQMLVQSGPPGCNMNYPICSILYPRSSFLANYPFSLKLAHLHQKFMKVQSITIQRINRHKCANQIKKGIIYFQNSCGTKSKQYSFSINPTQNQIEVEINEKCYWQFIIIVPQYNQGSKSMPYQIGFVGAKGVTISKNKFIEQLSKIILHSVKIYDGKNKQKQLQFTISNLKLQSKNVIQVQAQVQNLQFQSQTIIKSSQFQRCFGFKNKNIIVQQLKENTLKNIEKLSPQQFVKIYTKNRQLQPEINKIILKSKHFSFKVFNENQIKMFLDISLIFSKQQFSQLIDKINNQSEFGKVYMNEIFEMMGEGMFLPQTWKLSTIVGLLNQKQCKVIIDGSLSKIKKEFNLKNNEYFNLRKLNISETLFDTSQYGKKYLQMIDLQNNNDKKKKLQEERLPMYQNLIQTAKFAVIKQDQVRRIIVDLSQIYLLQEIILKFDRSQIVTKANIRIFKWCSQTQKKVQLTSKNLKEHHWIQITKNPYRKQMTQMFQNVQNSSLNCIGIYISNIQCRYLEVQISNTLTSLYPSVLEEQNNPTIEIIPDFYGNPQYSSNKIKQQNNGKIQRLNKQFFEMEKQKMFFISQAFSSALLLNKFSVTKGIVSEFLYYQKVSQDPTFLKKSLQQKIEIKQYSSAVQIYRKLMKLNCSSTDNYNSKPGLAFYYCLIINILTKMIQQQWEVDKNISEKILNIIIKEQIGPIQKVALKSISHHTDFLIQSLQYLPSNQSLPTLKNLKLQEKDLQNALKYRKKHLCQALVNIIISNMEVTVDWISMVIKLSQITQNNEKCINFILKFNNWDKNVQCLKYLSTLNVTLLGSAMNSKSLCQYFIACSKNNLLISYNKILEIVLRKPKSQIFIDQKVIDFLIQGKSKKNWQLLFKTIDYCPSVKQKVHHAFLNQNQYKKSEIFRQFKNLFDKCLESQNSNQIVLFLSHLYIQSHQQFVRALYQMHRIPKIKADTFKNLMKSIIFLLNQYCNYGGPQGSIFLTEKQLQNIESVKLLIQNCQFSEDSGIKIDTADTQALIKWYLHNNQWESNLSSPINRCHGITIIKKISNKVLKNILINSPMDTILKVFRQENKKILEYIEQGQLQDKNSFSWILAMDRIKNGMKKLIQCSNTPNKLAKILNQEGIQIILQQIEEKLKNNEAASKVRQFKEVQLTQIMEGITTKVQSVKDWQANKQGSNNKNPIIKIPIAHSKLKLKLTGSSSNNYFTLNKFIIGFAATDTSQKQAIFPAGLSLYGGIKNETSQANSEFQSFFLGNLQEIEDQYYQSIGIKVYGLNFNKLSMMNNINFQQTLEIQIKSPMLPSLCQVAENSQKVKKNSIYSVSFVSIMGVQITKDQLNQILTWPKKHCLQSPLQTYLHILQFLSKKQYRCLLKQLVQNQKMRVQILPKMIRMFKSMLPNKQIEQIMISIFEEGGDILNILLQTNDKVKNQLLGNCQLIHKILKQKSSIKDLQKVLDSVTNSQLNDQNIKMITQSLYFASCKPDHTDQINIDFKTLLQKFHQNSKNIHKNYQQMLIGFLLKSQNIISCDRLALTKELLVDNELKNENYRIISSYIEHFPEISQWIFQSQNFKLTFEQLISLMSEIQQNPQNSQFRKVQNCIMLIVSLVSFQKINKWVVSQKFPLTILSKLYNADSLLRKYPQKIMKLFIFFFQKTCISNQCEQKFNEQLINLLQKLPQINAAYHNFFIHQFFFPLINAYKGVQICFKWKGVKDSDQPTHFVSPVQALQFEPIKSSNDLIRIKGQYYKLTKNANIDKMQNLLICQKQSKKIIACKQGDKWSEIENDNLKPSDKFVINSQIHNVYVLMPNQKQKQLKLLTNQTLIASQNPHIFSKAYISPLPFFNQIQRIYYIPNDMTLQQILRQITMCGYRLDQQSIQNVTLNSQNTQNVPLKTKICDLKQKTPILKIQIEAASLFKFSSLQKIISESQKPIISFISQQTVFKTFEKLKGLEKMIKVMMSCVTNWKNEQQSKAWKQYLQQLQSFSCFPIFSSIYMAKQENVQLLFDILLGLPDKQDNNKWIRQQKKSVKFLYDIVKDVFQVQGQKAIQIRNYALQSDFYSTMLQRMHMITKQPKRQKIEQQENEEDELELPDIQKKDSEQQYKQKVRKKKGIGYGHDGNNSNQKWDVTGQEQARKQQSEQVLLMLKILEKFLGNKGFQPPKEIIHQSFESALLPILEASLRGGSLLQISKYAELFSAQLQFIKTIAQKKNLVPLLIEIPKIYVPNQPQSIQKLLKTLQGTSRIFLSCLTGSVTQKTSQQIAKSILETYEIIQDAINQYRVDNIDEDEQKKILEMPLPKKYPLLMQDLRFDYVDMKDKTGKLKHHYNSNYSSNHTPPAQKTIRLAQQLADISHALPVQHTNSIYVRCDKQRVDFMQALIMGSNGTPYGHGAFLFDIYFQDSYPNNPPKVNLTTTGSGKIRFNPNLYACGKVCLSLLGTWRGNAMENWDSKVSTLLQVLVSIQSIIMSQQVYFNQPGFEHQQGTLEGQKKNQAYANIVRYGNIKFAMIQNLKNPPKGFQTVIKRHFYLKKQQIMQQCKKWLKYAQKRQASYTGLISDHNREWCNQFKKTKTTYKTMLENAIQQLQRQLNKLEEPSSKDLLQRDKSPKKDKKKKEQIQSKDADLSSIDVTYDKNINYKQLDINDQKVKDRWSRYIGAMGIQAVSKQSKANILLIGLGALGVQIAKNIVLSGCRKISIFDKKNVSWQDLSGQFFVNEDDIGKNRVETSIYKLQQLNNYVRVQQFKKNFEEDLETLKQFDVVIASQLSFQQAYKINEYLHKQNKKFILVDCYGPYGMIFNDFGQKFEVLDKNGQQTVQVMIQNISSQQQATVTLLKGFKHSYEDGDFVKISQVKGMDKLQNAQIQSPSINQTLHKIKVINKSSFKIGNTLHYSPYQGNGLCRNIKTPIQISFKPLKSSLQKCNLDSNLQFYDFAKSTHNKTLHYCFQSLDLFKVQNQQKMPQPWDIQDSTKFLQIYKKLKKQQITEDQQKIIRKFSFTCTGTLAPLCAFFGGFVAQQAFKGITGKYMPTNQLFYCNFDEIIPQQPKILNEWAQFANKIKKQLKLQNRFVGLSKIVGKELVQELGNCRVFVIGSGAIGCQLLKNYAMINLSVNQKTQNNKGGQIVVTDPDHIQTSNLNRQFLFRQKHLQKPKSVTAAAAVTQMNPLLKGKIRAKLDKVCDATKDIFSNQFFDDLTIVTNALDNIQARQYVDLRCLQNKKPLLQSGTLSSKGHVQVIIPYKTQTYGSQADPAEDGQIPHCTLKMFPQQTLHCVQWARDIFGKAFSMKPKALNRLLEMKQSYVPCSSDIQMLQDSLKMLKNKPTNFDDCVFTAAKKFYQFYRNDIKQLLYTYPLDAKTKDGKPFWKLPKRPPFSIDQINPNQELHAKFITSSAVLMAKTYNIPYPIDFRSSQTMFAIAQEASKIKIPPFVPSDKLAKQMSQEVQQQNQKKQESSPSNEKNMMEQQQNQLSQAQLFNQIKQILNSEDQIKISVQEFQKDDDQNGHIDLIYSMANLRASNYKLDPMDWITTKLKAGKITPALSTTTSCIAGLQTLQLIKYIKNCAIDKMKNVFLNLAVPMIQAGQPGQVQKIKIHEKLTTNIWERWEVGPLKRGICLKDLINQIQKKYDIIVKTINILNGGPIYSDIVLGLQSKKNEKQKVLNKQLSEIMIEQQLDSNKKFLDLTIVLGVGQEFIKHVPTLRVIFE